MQLSFWLLFLFSLELLVDISIRVVVVVMVVISVIVFNVLNGIVVFVDDVAVVIVVC